MPEDITIILSPSHLLSDCYNSWHFLLTWDKYKNGNRYEDTSLNNRKFCFTILEPSNWESISIIHAETSLIIVRIRSCTCMLKSVQIRFIIKYFQWYCRFMEFKNIAVFLFYVDQETMVVTDLLLVDISITLVISLQYFTQNALISPFTMV